MLLQFILIVLDKQILRVFSRAYSFEADNRNHFTILSNRTVLHRLETKKTRDIVPHLPQGKSMPEKVRRDTRTDRLQLQIGVIKVL